MEDKKVDIKNLKEENLISLNNIYLKYDDKVILDNISLDIKKNDFITIIGPNGAGKSLLLKVMMGLVIPTSGIINKNKKLKVGYVPQRIIPPLTLPITVKRFLSLKKQIEPKKLAEILKNTNIENLMNANLSNLSPGELQRVLLARSLLNSPDILILDEPAQNMDVSSQMAFYKLINEIYLEYACSIVMVSHDLHLVMASSQKVVCLFHHICCSGKPEMVAKDPKFISMFGEDMSKMMAVYQHTHNHQHTHDGCQTLQK